MIRKFGKAALLAAMLGVGLGSGSAWGATEVDFSDGDSLTSTGTTTIGTSTNVFTSGTVTNVSETSNITVSDNINLVFGSKDGSSAFGNPFKYTLTGGVTLADTTNGSHLTLMDYSGSNITLTGALDSIATGASANSTVTIGASNNSNKNILTVGSIVDHSLGALTIGDGSQFVVKSTNVTILGNKATPLAANNRYNITLDGGTADFRAGNLELQAGTISGSGTVIGNTTLNGDTVASANITVDGGQHQTYTGSVFNTNGTIKVDTTSNARTAEMIITDSLQVAADSPVEVLGNGANASLSVANNMTVLSDTGKFTIGGLASGKGTVQAGSLTMRSPGAGAESYISVNDGGTLKTGSNGSTGIDSITLGVINVEKTGLAEFNNKVMVNGSSTITADDEGSITFKNTVTTSNNNNILTAKDGGTMTFMKELSLGKNDELVLDNGGTIDYSLVAAPLTIEESNGQIISKGTSALNTFATAGLTGSKADAVVIQDGSELELLRTKDSTNYAAYVADANQSIKFDNGGGTFSVGDMTVTSNVNGDIYRDATIASTPNAMNIKGIFTVEEDAFAKGNASVSTTVDKEARIFGTYIMADTANVFNDDIIVSGANAVLGTDGTGVAIDQMANKSLTVKNGATLGNGNTLTINPIGGAASGTTKLVFNGSTGTNKVYGTINANNSNAIVNSDLDIDGILNVKTYEQTAGTVFSSAGGSTLNVLDTATAKITGPKSVFGIDGNFNGGLDVLDGATLLGTGNTIAYTGTGTGKLNVDSLSSIDLSSGNMKVTGFDKVKADGTILIGYNYGDGVPNYLDLGGANLETNTETSIKFTRDFMETYYENGKEGANDYVITNGLINDGKPGEWTKSTMFGDFTFTYNDTDGAYISLYEKRDINDKDDVKQYLGSQYGRQYMSGNVVGNTMGIFNETIGSDGSLSGDLNESIFNAIIGGDNSFDFNNKSYDLNDAIFKVMSGSTAAAPIYIAQDSIRNIQGTLNSRLEAFRAVKECVVNECYSSGTALGSMDILNERYLNRVWAGVIGSWQNASERKGYEGYKYKPAGGIIGYDRAFGPMIAGVSFSFQEGNFDDKAFSWNDSKIRQYNVNLYATYNASSGFFATIMGGYNYSRNKLNYGTGTNTFHEKYGTNTLYANGKLGYDVMPCDNFSITPSVGVNYFYSRSRGHDVDFDNTAMMRYRGMKNHQVELPVEVKVAYEIPFSDKSGLTLMANGGYAYNFNDKGIRGNVSNTGLVGTEPGSSAVESRGKSRKLGHHAWMAGAGVKFRYDRWDVGVKYDYYGRHKADNHQITGTIGYSF